MVTRRRLLRENASKEHYIYRLYDHDGQLLYVGITFMLGNRFSQHRREKFWWGDVAEARVQPCENRRAALKAERNAIADENPIYNVQRPSPSVYDDVRAA